MALEPSIYNIDQPAQVPTTDKCTMGKMIGLL